MLFTPEFTYKHRKYNRTDCPSWGDEGWTVTPLSGYGDRHKFQAPFLFDDDGEFFPSGSVQVKLPDQPPQVKSTIVRLKSTLVMKRVTIIEVTDRYVYLDDPDRVIGVDYVGGIISIARFDEESPSFDSQQSIPVQLHYEPASGNIHPLCSIWHRGGILKLDPNCLHDLKLTTVFEGAKVEIPTAWVDPGFDGTLYVPWMEDSPAELTITSYRYNGKNRYEGYTGDNRLKH